MSGHCQESILLNVRTVLNIQAAFTGLHHSDVIDAEHSAPLQNIRGQGGNSRVTETLNLSRFT